MKKDFSEMSGLTITDILGCTDESENVSITFSDGSSLSMDHRQDCCEFVRVEEVHGDPLDLIGAKVAYADEAITEAEGVSESGTATFYRIVTDKADLTIRWLGESNGYYAEDVTVTWYNVPIKENDMNLSKKEKIDFIMETQQVDNSIKGFREMFNNIDPKLMTVFEERYGELITITKDIWDAHYTDKEIDAYYGFFSSPIGKSISSKIPMILKQSKVAGEEWGKSIVIEAFPEYAKFMDGSN